ncbi:DUF2690 domain-containing protein [Microbacterium oxydans]|uniref:DUF2690 domain-containing protein n=1 Tax=Microbacterium oxydans TaxID=82380 RepID=A0A0F0LIQ2_9MICO|nr:DUF2690 domain-containing protein [Microbacterium oxydans]KJL33097.1 hypothetical protein RS83_00145 [Microbacterium oxydans]
MRSVRISLAIVAVAALVAVSMPTAAQAAFQASPYDNTNPQTTGCAADAVSLVTYPINSTTTGLQVGTLDVRYSANCDSNWVRVNNTIAGAVANKYIARHRTHLPEGGAMEFVEQTESDQATGWSYGMQFGRASISCIAVGGWLSTTNGTVIAIVPGGSKVLC